MPAKLDLSMGKLMLAEIQEFGTFRLEVQRYICRSLDIAFCPDARSADWARDEDEAERVNAQVEVYQDLPAIRRSVPSVEANVDADRFLFPLMALTTFELSCSPIGGFAAYRFLYERLFGARVRPWLPAAFCAAAGLPHVPSHFRRALVDSARSALGASWSAIEPTFFPKWPTEALMCQSSADMG